MSASESGHNSKEQLKSIVDRIENLAEQIKELRSDQNDILTEGKSAGYDIKALRRVLAIRKMGSAKHEEFEGIVEAYLQALDGR